MVWTLKARRLRVFSTLGKTDFNLRGESIVTTPQNAYSTFARSELDLLVAGDCLVTK